MANRQAVGGQGFSPSTDRAFDDKSDMETNLTSLAPSLRKLLQMTAQTSEEKFKMLDARDKLYKIMRDKESTLKRGALVATCTDMCPEKERLLREYQGRGSIFEMTNFSKNSSFNHSLAVKEYARSSADQEEPLPHDLRPVHVLTMTMSHLLHNVVDYCELSDENLEDWYMFMWDRTRALRKELTQQGVCNMESVTLVEQCARFHIHCAERLIDQDSSIYDDKINTENLTKCLQTLKYMYKDLAKEDIKCSNEPEFICYSLLLNLNNSSVFTELSGMSNSLMNSEQVKFALNVMATWETKNYIRFFNLVKKTSYLNCCLLRRYFGEMRLYAIKTMIRSYCTKNYSPQILITRFVETLNFEREEECLNFLSYCHFNFHEVSGKTVVNFDRVLFQNPSDTISSGRAFLFIEEKKQKPLSVIMAGGTLPPRLFETYVPHSSFTPDGDLVPDRPPQKELIDFFLTSASYKSPPSTLDVFLEREQQIQSVRDPRLRKEETSCSPTSMFTFKEKNIQPTNAFEMVRPSFCLVSKNSNVFANNFSNSNSGSFGNIFDSPIADNSKKNIFGNQTSSSLFGNDKSIGFGLEPKFAPPTFSPSNIHQEITKLENNNVTSGDNLCKGASSHFETGFQNNSELVISDEKLKEEKEYKEKLEKEEEQKRKRKEEEEKARILLERKLVEEEKRRKEMERREREKREKEYRRKEELASLEREEAARKEKMREANARYLEKLKREEENRRRIELEYKQKVDTKMLDLTEKMKKWKTKIILDKWRVKTWTRIEERKMKEYFKEVKVKYPPICTEEMLNGNPFGLLIPSALTFEKFRNWKKQEVRKANKKLLIVNDELPLLNINSILGKPLENLSKSMGSKLDPFSWKLIISLPDDLESPDYWKTIETFVEMHFVENFRWQFGVEKGPLYCRGGNYGSFRFNISIRRLRGSQLYEGNQPNVNATAGSNALLFFMSKCGNEISCERLKAVLESRPPLPKIPVIIIVINSNIKFDVLKKLLNLEAFEKSHISKYFVIPIYDYKQPIVQLSRCLSLAAISSSSPSPFRINKFSTFFCGSWIESLWRRVEISLSNFKIIMREPKVLIEFYNACIDELSNIFLDKKHSQYTVLAQEFCECELPLHSARTPVYESRLKSLLERLKLPHWPVESPKSCHQLNYRIHQYCKKVTGQNKAKIKNLKWILYRIIRQSLSWKGLDIYCDEDIYEILTNFPWIQVFKEISRITTRQICEEVKDGKEVIIIYDLERVENFSFEASFIGKFLRKSKRESSKNSSFIENEEQDESTPCLEKDSVLYAYSVAIKRETFKRKREEYFEEGLDAFFSSPSGKRIILEEEEQPGEIDFSGVEANFQALNERLDGMKKQMTENLKILMDIQNEMQ